MFVNLPTGFGKTLCYTCLPVLFDALQHHDTSYSIIIIISPLVALMNDQVRSLNSKGVSAVHGSRSDSDNCDMKDLKMH